MRKFYERYQLVCVIVIVGATGFLAWYFSNIISYILIAAVLGLIGNPLVRQLDRIRIGKIRFPHVLSVILTLMLLLAVFAGFFSFFIPLVIREAQMISSIDMDALSGHFAQEIDWIETWLIQLGVMDQKISLLGLIQKAVINLMNLDLFSSVLTDIFTFTGKVFFDLFSVLFITFFFMMDPTMVRRIILTLMPEKYHDQTSRVLTKSKELLTRYFIGLVLDLLVMILSYAIGLSIAGIDGALVIAFFAGIVNIIPYLGPLIGTSMGLMLGITSMISSGHYTMIGHTAFVTGLVFLIVILIDNVVYQPLIYGKSVKAHPIEIFLVIIAAGSIGGIIGMIIAVPVYTFLRIVAKEFLSQFRVVRSLTEKI